MKPALNKGPTGKGKERLNPVGIETTTDDITHGGTKWSLDDIIGSWKDGKLLETAEKFSSELGITIPKWLGVQIDAARIKVGKLYGSEIPPGEFLILTSAAILGVIWVYITLIPWKYRLMVGIIALAMFRKPSMLIGVVITILPTFWNRQGPESMRISKEGSEWLTAAGALALLVALSGQFNFQITIGILGTGALTFLSGCMKKAANHSISGANKAMTYAAAATMIISMVGVMYYHHEINKWYVCGALTGSNKDWCEEKLINGIKFQVEDWIDSHYKSEHRMHTFRRFNTNIMDTGGFTNLIAYVGMALALAALSLPGIINVLGAKYKDAGAARMAALKRSKSESSFSTADIRPNLTLADYSVSNDNAPLFMTGLIGCGYLLYDPPVGVTLISITIAGQLIGYAWFKAFLADDFALEGSKAVAMTEELLGENGMAKAGRSRENLLPYKSSIAVVAILTVCSGLAGFGLCGVLGLALAAFPGSVYYIKPREMGTVALGVYAVVATGTGNMLLGGLIIAASTASATKYTMKLKTTASEEVATPIDPAS